jgi:hypothetical protein
VASKEVAARSARDLPEASDYVAEAFHAKGSIRMKIKTHIKAGATGASGGVHPNGPGPGG